MPPMVYILLAVKGQSEKLIKKTVLGKL